MKIRILSLVLTVSLMLGMLLIPVSAADVWDGSATATSFAGGTGTEQDPYQISNGAELRYFRTQCGNNGSKGKYYILTQNIDLGNHEWAQIPGIFYGNLNGNGKTIKGFKQTATTSNEIGFFSRIEGTVYGLTMEGRVEGVFASNKNHGLLASMATGSSKFENCTMIVNMLSEDKDGTMKGATVGGFFGRYAYGCTMENCKVYGSITVETAATSTNNTYGGFCGRLDTSSATNCESYVDITVTNTNTTSYTHLGGFAGAAYKEGPQFTGVVNYGDLKVISPQNSYIVDVGGMIGRVGFSEVANVTMTRCFNLGDLVLTGGVQNTENGVGFYVGDMAGVIENASTKLTLVDCFGAGATPVGSADKAIWSGASKGMFTNTNYLANVSLNTLEGAAVRLNDPTGLRFDTEISNDLYSNLNNRLDVEFTMGTLIAPTNYVEAAGEFTMEALDALKEKQGFEFNTYKKVVFDTETYDFLEETPNTRVYSGAIADIYETNYDLSYSAIGYMTITIGTTTVTVYADYSETDNARTVAYIGYLAYTDRTDTQDADHPYFVEEDNNYSPYKTGELEKIKVFSDAYDAE